MGNEFSQAWSVVSGAPILSILTLLVIIGFVWAVVHFLYRHRIDGLKEEIDRLRARQSAPPVKATPPPPAPRPASHTPAPAAAKMKISAASARDDAVEKVFVPDDMTPSTLMALCDGKTGMQAEALTRVYVGKWVVISGSISNITDHETYLYVAAEVPGIYNGKPTMNTVWLTFHGDRDHLEMLQKGAPLAAIGRIRRVRYVSMDFDDCELITAP